jgi:hypothetical protein
VFLFGPSQVGKSWGLIHDAEEHDDGRTIYVRCSSISGLHGLMSVIGSRIGVACTGDTGWRQRNVLYQLAKDEGLKAICERLRYAHRFARQGGRDAIDHVGRCHERPRGNQRECGSGGGLEVVGEKYQNSMHSPVAFSVCFAAEGLEQPETT